MNNLPLQLIFNDIEKNNIIINLEKDTFCHTLRLPSDKFIIPEKNIAYIYSKSDISQIMDNIIEEGSTLIIYSYILSPVIKEEIFKKLLHSFFIKYNFHIKFIPSVSSQKNVRKIIGDFEIVITDKDISKSFIELWIEEIEEKNHVNESLKEDNEDDDDDVKDNEDNNNDDDDDDDDVKDDEDDVKDDEDDDDDDDDDVKDDDDDDDVKDDDDDVKDDDDDVKDDDDNDDEDDDDVNEDDDDDDDDEDDDDVKDDEDDDDVKDDEDDDDDDDEDVKDDEDDNISTEKEDEE